MFLTLFPLCVPKTPNGSLQSFSEGFSRQFPSPEASEHVRTPLSVPQTLYTPAREHLAHCFAALCLSVCLPHRQWATCEQDFLSDHPHITRACLRVWQTIYWKKRKKWSEMKWNRHPWQMSPRSPLFSPVMEFHFSQNVYYWEWV